MVSRRPKRPKRPKPPPLDEDLILSWADAHFERTGKWPIYRSGPIIDSSGESWQKINAALYHGYRGLLPHSSLATLLEDRRGVVNPLNQPRFTIDEVLGWADAYFDRIGEWPTAKSGAIPERNGENWLKVECALKHGYRGLSPGLSLSLLLLEHRGVVNRINQPKFTEDQILSWADAYFIKHGEWPRSTSGEIPEALGQNWHKVERALNDGLRGLQPGSTLALLLQERRGAFNRRNQPQFTIDQILNWADAHFERTGKWPTYRSGPIPDSPGENWTKVNAALYNGYRGLQSHSSLANLLHERRGVVNRLNQPDLTISQILEWADLHKKRHGRYPVQSDGVVEDARDERWSRVDGALQSGIRGLKGGSSLATLLQEHRGNRHQANLPRFQEDQILAWADAHFARTGRWPAITSGPVRDAPDETWAKINDALRKGFRGLLGGSSLARFLAAHRGKRDRSDRPRFSLQQITAWVQLHTLRHGKPPTIKSGVVDDAPEEHWEGIHRALVHGYRGLPGGSSLAKLKASLNEN